LKEKEKIVKPIEVVPNEDDGEQSTGGSRPEEVQGVVSVVVPKVKAKNKYSKYNFPDARTKKEMEAIADRNMLRNVDENPDYPFTKSKHYESVVYLHIETRGNQQDTASKPCGKAGWQPTNHTRGNQHKGKSLRVGRGKGKSCECSRFAICTPTDNRRVMAVFRGEGHLQRAAMLCDWYNEWIDLFGEAPCREELWSAVEAGFWEIPAPIALGQVWGLS
jgi:hypothetical protein